MADFRHTKTMTLLHFSNFTGSKRNEDSQANRCRSKCRHHFVTPLLTSQHLWFSGVALHSSISSPPGKSAGREFPVVPKWLRDASKTSATSKTSQKWWFNWEKLWFYTTKMVIQWAKLRLKPQRIQLGFNQTVGLGISLATINEMTKIENWNLIVTYIL